MTKGLNKKIQKRNYKAQNVNSTIDISNLFVNVLFTQQLESLPKKAVEFHAAMAIREGKSALPDNCHLKHGVGVISNKLLARKTSELVALIAVSCTLFLFLHTRDLSTKLRRMEGRLNDDVTAFNHLTDMSVIGVEAVLVDVPTWLLQPQNAVRWTCACAAHVRTSHHFLIDCSRLRRLDYTEQV
ncbi:hypothetical protein SFRURICE_012379 [Spodoptera frugiperda]|nr:hypothetical protein SFRURICE_012379 [Spodoptera frugiperda]